MSENEKEEYELELEKLETTIDKSTEKINSFLKKMNGVKTIQVKQENKKRYIKIIMKDEVPNCTHNWILINNKEEE